MITKQIIHLKNVVIFKVLIYFLILMFFFFIFPILNNYLEISIKSTENAKTKLQDLENKILFVNHSQDEIIASYNRYLAIEKSNFDLSCFLQKDLDESYQNLAREIGLDQKPALYSSANPLVEKFGGTRNIEIYTTNLISEFMSKTVYESLSFIERFYQILPKYQFLTSIDINMEELITPESINRLSKDIVPSLIKNKINMQVRQIHILSSIK